MIKKLNNITFPVSDLKKVTEFYEKVLGLKKQGEWSTYVIFDCGGVELAFEPGGSKGAKKGWPYIFLVVDDVDAETKKLKDKGVKFKSEPKDQSWGGKVASLTDPDGNVICLLQWKEK